MIVLVMLGMCVVMMRLIPLLYDEVEIHKLEKAEGVYDEKGYKPSFFISLCRVPERIAFERQYGKREERNERYAEHSKTHEPERTPPKI